MVDQLGSNEKEHIFESLLGHGWWTMGSKEEEVGWMKFKGFPRSNDVSHGDNI
jgi:hypothetical protein